MLGEAGVREVAEAALLEMENRGALSRVAGDEVKHMRLEDAQRS